MHTPIAWEKRTVSDPSRHLDLQRVPMADPSPTGIRPIVRWRLGGHQTVEDELALEEPLEIRVRGRAITIAMRTPGHDDELAAGFLLAEGVIAVRHDVWRIEPCLRDDQGNVIHVQLAPEIHVDLSRLTRHIFTASSCGLCGKDTIDAICSRMPAVSEPGPSVVADTLAAMPQTMREVQTTFDRTGGLHAAAIFTAEGELLVLREDVGRHNAVDKVIGHALLRSWLPLSRHVLLVSGRTSFEILQKALAARIPLVAAVSAPSSLAADFADESGQTLVGFLRPGQMNVYTHPHRVAFSDAAAGE